MLLEPTTVDELQAAVRYCERAIPVGAGTKPALSSFPDTFERISTLHLSGIVEYEPSEFTITVLAGTPVQEITDTLAEHGQYLPFDPPLAAAGATIGGTVASGLSGPGAFRFGPLRDFLIGIRFVDSEGRLLSGGGKVVKNAAGFDLPKFLIDSCGRLGVFSELTFKVFPKPEAEATFGITPRNLDDVVRLIHHLSRSALDLDALDFEPKAKVVRGRIRGNADALERRLEQIAESLPDGHFPFTICESSDAEYFWNRQLSFDWADGCLAKVPITPDRIPALEKQEGVSCVYSMGGNVAWVSGNRDEVMRVASSRGWPFQFLRPRFEPADGEPVPVAFTKGGEIEFAVKQAFDPVEKFPPLVRNPLFRR
jgi:glycolate oxidase FAD binding subunit